MHTLPLNIYYRAIAQVALAFELRNLVEHTTTCVHFKCDVWSCRKGYMLKVWAPLAFPILFKLILHLGRSRLVELTSLLMQLNVLSESSGLWPRTDRECKYCAVGSACGGSTGCEGKLT